MERMCLRIAYRSSWDAYRSSWDAYRSSWDAYRSSWDAYRSSWDAYRSSWDAYRSSWDAYRSSSAKRPTCKQVGLFATYYFLFPPLTRKVPPISPSSLLMPLLLPVVLCTDSALFLNQDRKSTRLNSSHVAISYAVFCLKKKKTISSRLS